MYPTILLLGGSLLTTRLKSNKKVSEKRKTRNQLEPKTEICEDRPTTAHNFAELGLRYGKEKTILEILDTGVVAQKAVLRQSQGRVKAFFITRSAIHFGFWKFISGVHFGFWESTVVLKTHCRSLSLVPPRVCISEKESTCGGGQAQVDEVVSFQGC